MKRIRGRRVALLIASALPLLAEDEIVDPLLTVIKASSALRSVVAHEEDSNDDAGYDDAMLNIVPRDRTRALRAIPQLINEGQPSDRVIEDEKSLLLGVADRESEQGRQPRSESEEWTGGFGAAAASLSAAISNESILPFLHPFEQEYGPFFLGASRQPHQDIPMRGKNATLFCSRRLIENSSHTEPPSELKGDAGALERLIRGDLRLDDDAPDDDDAADDPMNGKPPEPERRDSRQDEETPAILVEADTENVASDTKPEDSTGGAKMETADGSNESSLDPSQEAPTGAEDQAAAVADASTEAATSESELDAESVKHVAVDYASKSVGALILDSSPNFQGASNLLQSDRDKYAIVPCEEPSKYVVIGLSEDILVKQIVIANYERYSSHMREIRLSGSATTAMGRDNWVDLGTYVTTAGDGSSGKQIFGLTEQTWARYLKAEFLSHHGDEFYCTVSQISVHGSTVLQGFHEQWGEDESSQNDDVESASDTESEAMSSSDQTTTAPDNKAHTSDEAGGIAQESEFSRGDSWVGSVGLKGGRTSVYFGGSKNARPRGISSVLDQCVRQLPSDCPDTWNFEHRILHFASGSVSEFDRMGALTSASVCLSSRQLVTPNKSVSATVLLPNRRSARGPIVRQSEERGFRLVAANENPAILANALYGLPPVVERIKGLMRATAGVVNLEEITNRLRFSVPVTSKRAGVSEPQRPTGTVDVSLKVNEPLAASVAESQVNSQGKAASAADPGAGAKSSTTATDQRSGGVKVPENVAKNDKTSDAEDLHATGLALANVLQRLPSAKCLETLNFAEFKASTLKTRSGSGSAGSGGPGGNMEPIFKKLTDEIKTLQANVAVHDQFAKESISCYQRVMLEMLMEMESARLSQDARISKLENDLKLGALVVALQHVVASLVARLISSLRVWYSVCLLLARRPEVDADTMVSLGGALFILAAYCFVSMISRWRRSRLGHLNLPSPKISGMKEDSASPELTKLSVASELTKTVATPERPSNCTTSARDRMPSSDSTDQSCLTHCSESKLTPVTVSDEISQVTVSPE